MEPSIEDLVAATLTEFGMPAPANFIQTMLMRDGFFFGWKFRYDGGHAILRADGNAMEFYAEDGKLLKTVTVEAKKEEAA